MYYQTYLTATSSDALLFTDDVSAKGSFILQQDNDPNPKHIDLISALRIFMSDMFLFEWLKCSSNEHVKDKCVQKMI